MRLRALLTFTGLIFAIILVLSWSALLNWFSDERIVLARTLVSKFHFPVFASVLAPEDPPIFFAIGNYYLSDYAHDPIRAEKFYKQALGLGYEKPAYVYFELSKAYFFQTRYGKAIETLRETLRADPSFVRAYYMRGLAYGYKNDLLEAEKDFLKFLELKPESWAGANDLAWIYFRQGRFEEVRKVTEKALSYNPENPWLHNSLGVALLNLGDKEGAKIALEKALSGFKSMSPREWGRAYPGNDARFYALGLASTINSVEKNLAVLSASVIKVIQ